jgi:hypothetical protein
MQKYLVLYLSYAIANALLFATANAAASTRFACKDPGPCTCMLSTAQYYMRTDDRVTVSCINTRTGEQRFFDSVSRADWDAANKNARPATAK